MIMSDWQRYKHTRKLPSPITRVDNFLSFPPIAQSKKKAGGGGGRLLKLTLSLSLGITINARLIYNKVRVYLLQTGGCANKFFKNLSPLD